MHGFRPGFKSIYKDFCKCRKIKDIGAISTVSNPVAPIICCKIKGFRSSRTSNFFIAFFETFEQSEKELQNLRQRTKEGLLTARLSGRQIGQVRGIKLTTKKSVTAKEIILKHNKTFGGSLNDAEAITRTGISRKTFYKYKKELLLEAAS